MTETAASDVLGVIEQWPAHEDTRAARRFGVDRLLRWLATLPGATWQERWQNSPAPVLGHQWPDALASWLTDQGDRLRTKALRSGLLVLVVADVIRPDAEFLLLVVRSRHWQDEVLRNRDPDGFARLKAASDPRTLASPSGTLALTQVAVILLLKGGGVADITVGDCLELRSVELVVLRRRSRGRALFYTMLKKSGLFPAVAPATLRAFNVYSGQLSAGQLVDRYDLQCRPVRDLIVDYLAERQPALDYSSFDNLARTLALNFWKNLEIDNPGIASLHLAPDVVATWKKRLQTKVVRRRAPDGSATEVARSRGHYLNQLGFVRAFYLDIAQWALEDPARWAPWAAPSPVSSNEITYTKHLHHRKARMDQRTRERVPVLPALVRVAAQRLRDAQTRLAAVKTTKAGSEFVVLGETYLKLNSKNRRDIDSSFCVLDTNGHKHHLNHAENRAFWGWAAIEFLRHTGVRIEEMMETGHHSITQHRLPTTGEVIPLLQIAPSKSDRERLLVVSPKLADVLSATISRVRGSDGAVPLVPFWDRLEKVWLPPAPLLFQWYSNGEHRAVSVKTIRAAISEIWTDVGMTDAAGQLLDFQPHDFRRVFATEAIMNGMPPHIAQLLLGHQDINTTMGYKAVYPEEVVNGHRAFIARRRAAASQRGVPDTDRGGVDRVPGSLRAAEGRAG
ncbi:site-specific integrase [Amycolatopsis sp. WAC 04182]|uniref:site-specific integrase n=1 Tax=Amycolatopsis sp. WAC 04182 TaxID=2203198 RepID=UPI0018F76D74|nr:site-specific integrase [Amycolatopsis sp. WAC 04182]